MARSGSKLRGEVSFPT